MEIINIKINQISIPREKVWPLVEHLGFVRGILSALLDLPEVTVENGIADWWQGISQEERNKLEPFLHTLAAPVMVVNFSLVNEKQIFSARTVLHEEGNSDMSYVISQETPDEMDLNAVQPPNAEDVAVKLWEALIDDDPPGYVETGWEIDRYAFLVLLAIADLHRRKTLAGLLHNTVFRPEMVLSDIEFSCGEGAPRDDPRWFLPFFESLMAEPSDWCKGKIEKSLDVLVNDGILEKSTRGVYRLSETGLFLVDSWNPPSVMGFQAWGADYEGRAAVQLCAFLRGNKFLWFIDVGEPESTVAIAGVEDSIALELLMEIFTPVGIPVPLSVEFSSVADGSLVKEEMIQCPACGTSVPASVRFCNNCGETMVTLKVEEQRDTESADVPIPKRFCRNCGQQLSPAATFCGQCGEKI